MSKIKICGITNLGHFVGRQYGLYAGKFLRLRGIDAGNACMRIRAAQQPGVQHAREAEIDREVFAAGDLVMGIRPDDAFADDVQPGHPYALMALVYMLTPRAECYRSATNFSFAEARGHAGQALPAVVGFRTGVISIAPASWCVPGNRYCGRKDTLNKHSFLFLCYRGKLFPLHSDRQCLLQIPHIAQLNG